VAKYDVAVVGAGLGGLAATALLSAKKKKTVIIQRGTSLNSAVGILEKDGFLFSNVPALSYGFERGSAIHDVSAGLGILHNAAVHSPCYQVALPDRRISVYADVSETLEELRREFPGEIDAIMRFYRDIHRQVERSAKNRLLSFLTRHRTAAGFLRSYGFSRELSAFYDVQLEYFFQKPSTESSLASLLLLCDSPPLYFHGGFKKIADQLYSVILQDGGEIRYREPSPRIVSQNDRAIGIETAQGIVEADVILLDRVPPRQPPALFVALHEEVVPVGMAEEVLFLPDYARPRDFISLSLSRTDDLSSAPEGMRALYASFRGQRVPPEDNQEFIAQISELVPFLKDYVVFSEQYRGDDEGIVVPANITFKPLRSADGMTLLSRGSHKNVYVLDDVQQAPPRVISAVQQFVRQLG
jgi:phytoene dehydrogenase-like protein